MAAPTTAGLPDGSAARMRVGEELRGIWASFNRAWKRSSTGSADRNATRDGDAGTSNALRDGAHSAAWERGSGALPSNTSWHKEQSRLSEVPCLPCVGEDGAELPREAPCDATACTWIWAAKSWNPKTSNSAMTTVGMSVNRRRCWKIPTVTVIPLTGASGYQSRQRLQQPMELEPWPRCQIGRSRGGHSLQPYNMRTVDLPIVAARVLAGIFRWSLQILRR